MADFREGSGRYSLRMPSRDNAATSSEDLRTDRFGLRRSSTDLGIDDLDASDDMSYESEGAGPLARKLIGVAPAAMAAERRELLGALEQVYPVSFRGYEPDRLGDLDALLSIGDAGAPGASGQLEPSLAGAARDLPRLSVQATNEGYAPSVAAIELADDAQLARPLRGRTLAEECAPARACAPQEGDLVLATSSGQPVWWQERGPAWTHHSVFGLEELGPEEALRDRLRTGHFMGLLPLLHLLRHTCRDLAWDERPLSAAFIVDDPNLHAGSYGYLNFRELIAHAERHGYHLGLATVPLDGWMCSRRAARLVKGKPNALSLLMHGNSHLAGELGRLTDERMAESAMAQALCRIAAFERRSGIPVERIMAPPHELCSTAALAAMFRLGFEGACIGRRHPWRDRPSLSRLTSARLLKWHPTDLMGGGLPIVPRHPIEHSREELVFNALLRQPLILFSHHWDFADGLDLLEEATQEINGLGDVRWGSIGSIARDCYFTKRTGDTLHVQMHARRIVLEIPEGVEVVRVSTPSLLGDEPQRQLVGGAADVDLATVEGGWMSDALAVDSGAPMELRLACPAPLAPASLAHPKRSPWPIVRRVLVECRDRARPFLRRWVDAA